MAAKFALAGIGPFEAAIAPPVADTGGLTLTLTVTNKGSSTGQSTCQVTDPADRTGNPGAFILTPQIDGGRDAHVQPARDRARVGGPTPGDRVLGTVTDTATTPALAYAAELAFATELAQLAGTVLMDHYERLERIDYKSARDVVTEADHLSEALILDAIRARFPDDAILAEETGEHRAVAGEAPTSGRGRVWIVDPLDGTVNYANGIPVLLRLDRAGRRRAAGGRGHPRPDPARDVRRDDRRSGDPCRAPGPCLGQGEAVRLRHLDGR